MKNGKFETQAEIYKALLDGKKIKMCRWNNLFLELVGGVLSNSNKHIGIHTFTVPQAWELYQEPRETIDIYESFNELGTCVYCDQDGLLIDSRERFLYEPVDVEVVKQNIITPNKPKFRIYADTFEIVREGESEN